MQRHAHDQRPRLGKLQHLVELVDDHVSEFSGAHLACDDGWNVIHFLRIGHREDALAATAAEPDRLVVHAPVEEIAVAGFRQEVGRAVAVGDPRPQPALRLCRFGFRQAARRFAYQCALGGLIEVALPFGIGSAMAHDLIAARPHRRHEVGRVVVHRTVGEGGQRQLERIENVEQVPGPDAVPIVPPGKVEDVGLRPARGEFGAETFAEGKVLQVEGKVDGEPPAAGPRIVGSAA